jgi:hypothetical protein
LEVSSTVVVMRDEWRRERGGRGGKERETDGRAAGKGRGAAVSR